MNEAPEGDPVEIPEEKRIELLQKMCNQLSEKLANCKSELESETERANELSECLAGYAETKKELRKLKRAFSFLLKTTEYLSDPTIGYWEYSDE